MRELSYSEVAVAMGLGTLLSTGCGVGDQEDNGGADYGDAGVGGSSDEWFDEDTSSESSSSESSSSSTESSSTDSGTDTSTGTDTGGPTCGWSEAASLYACGFEGTDPGGTPIECPPDLVEGQECAAVGLTAVGCCDAEGNLWFCDVDVVALEACIMQ